MMCGSGGDKECGKGAGGDYFLMMQIITSINHGCHHCHMATIGPHSQQQSIKQSNDNKQQILVIKTRKNYYYYNFTRQ
jgi:hypothetical protein